MKMDSNLPLAGVRVVEFTHMVMGPTCGMMLADLGAEAIKVEPIDGDRTRRLLGAGAGFFSDVQPQQEKHPDRSAASSGSRGRTASVRKRGHRRREFQARDDGEIRARLRIACALAPAPDLRHVQGVPARAVRGPYALDEVVQMMGGLAYMTGRPGDPLRAGTSVNDIMGGCSERSARSPH
jgi:hypothetical protein